MSSQAKIEEVTYCKNEEEAMDQIIYLGYAGKASPTQAGHSSAAIGRKGAGTQYYTTTN